MATFAPRFTCRETAASLTSRNPIPYDGEICCESDTGKIKIGDGRTAWNDLGYAGDGTGLDFSVSSPVSGEILSYNGSAWVNTAASSGPTTKLVASNVSFTTATAISDFTFAAEANKTYMVQGVLLITMDLDDVHVVIGTSVPSGSTFKGSMISSDYGTLSTYKLRGGNSSFNLGNGIGSESESQSLSGILKTSSTAGNMTWTIAGNGGGAGTLAAGSCLTFTEI